MHLAAVDKNAKKLRESLRKFADPPTPDDVHRLRTRIRQFESAKQALGNAAQQSEKHLKDLDRIRKKAGKVRDLDVFTSHLASLHSVGENHCLVELLLHIGAKRRKQAAKLATLVRKKEPSLQGTIKKAVRKFRKQAGNKAGRANNEAVEQVNAARTQRFIEATQAPQLDRKNLHEYRKKIKSLGDVLRIASPDGNEALAGALKKSKDAIGEWHDWEQLRTIGEKVLQDHDNCKLLSALKATAQKKFQEALQATSKMRARYLKLTSSNRGPGKRAGAGDLKHERQPP